MPKGVYLRTKPNHWVGRKHSEASKLKQSLVKRGEKHPFYGKKRPEFAEKVRQALLGKKHTEERRRNNSKGQLNSKIKPRGEAHHCWDGGISKLSFKEQQEKKAGRPRPGECEACGKAGTICYDHDHQTGKFRGWICKQCNFALGLVKDDKEVLYALIKYLEKYP